MQPRIHAETYGTVGEPVVLVHGAGLGSGIYDEVAPLLAESLRVIVPDRRGYGRSAALGISPSLNQHTADLIALLHDRDLAGATFVGVSGGATLVLALTMTHPGAVHSALVHEPAIGPLAPTLLAMLRAASLPLLQQPTSGKALFHFLEALAGSHGWAHVLPRYDVLACADPSLVAAEVAQFLDFAPSADDFASLRTSRLATSIGKLSAAPRREVANRLAATAGARIIEVAGAAHLAPMETPEIFAAIVRQLIDEPATLTS